MNRAMTTTLLMGVSAAVLSAIAAVCYPWPQAIEVGQRVNQRLFEGLDAQQTRGITLLKYDRDEKRLDRIELRQLKDQWVIPSANNYPAGNSNLIAAIKDAVGESTVLEVKSDDEGTHPLYGVVDPETVSDASQTGIGSKIVLADTNQRPIASLIVGEQVGDERSQRFVRIADQPSVYVISFNPALLSTTLADWADHNLLGLKTSPQGPGVDVSGLTVENYTIDADTLMQPEYKLQQRYRARIVRANDTWTVADYQLPDADGSLQAAEGKWQPTNAGLSRLFATLLQIPFQNVIKKPREAIQVLSTEGGESAPLTAVANYGFRRNPGQPLQSAHGDLVVSSPGGIDFRLSFGRLVEMAPTSGSSLNYFMMITATTNEDAFPLPPAAADDSEAERDRYDRAVKRRADEIAAARRLVQQNNARFADWLYLVSEDTMQALRPAETELIQAQPSAK